VYLNNSITANAFLSVFVSTMLWLEAESVQEKLVRSGFARLPRGFLAIDNVLHGDQGVPGIRSGGQDLHGNQGVPSIRQGFCMATKGFLAAYQDDQDTRGTESECGS
jgi:hypothetical protein